MDATCVITAGLIAFRRDNISALISLCGAPATLEINLSAPVYLRSLDSPLRFILSPYLLPPAEHGYDATEQDPGLIGGSHYTR